MKSAIVLTGGLFESNNAKTAHGLARGSDRFHVVGIIDEVSAGKTAEQILPKALPIPIYKSLTKFLEQNPEGVDVCIIGIASKGGVLPVSLRPPVMECLQRGISVVNGLHQHLSNDAELSQLANASGAEIMDIRKPKPFQELHFWDGSIKTVKSLKIPVIGTDCALGKRTTTRMLMQCLKEAGITAEMIFTGQTGWLQGIKYGFIFDATLNDFISGELEAAMVACYHDLKPQVMLIEGQSGLRNPSGPCGSEMILSGAADAVILQIVPGRKKFKGLEDYPADIASPQDEIKLIEMYGAKVIALTINTEGLSKSEAENYAAQLEQELQIPVILPLENGLDRLIPVIQSLLSTHEN
jgi:uncharacterized NAD-dependent epimerase/dehydratase family protein